MGDISSYASRARALFTSCPRALGCTAVYGFGTVPRTLEGHFRMTNRRRTGETGFPGIRGQGRAIQQRGHSAPPRFRIDDSLISPTESPGTPPSRYHPGYCHRPMRRARWSPPSGTGFHTGYVRFPPLIRARARWGVRLCTDLGRSPPTLEGHFRMTNRRRTWETGFPDIRG